MNYFKLRVMVRQFYDVQKLRIQYDLRLQDLVRNGRLEKAQAERMYKVSLDHMKGAEKAINRQVKYEIREHPVWLWSKRVNGIGPTLAGALIAEIGADKQARLKLDGNELTGWVTHPERTPKIPKDPEKKLTPTQVIKKIYLEEPERLEIMEVRNGIECFENAGKLFAYSGLHVVENEEGKFVAPRRKKGEQSNWNPFLRTLAYKISDSFVKCGKCFRKVYDEAKEFYLSQGITNNHAHMRAKRKASKLWFSLAWHVWRESEGLPVRVPYCIEKQGHTTIIHPEDMTDK